MAAMAELLQQSPVLWKHHLLAEMAATPGQVQGVGAMRLAAAAVVLLLIMQRVIRALMEEAARQRKHQAEPAQVMAAAALLPMVVQMHRQAHLRAAVAAVEEKAHLIHKPAPTAKSSSPGEAAFLQPSLVQETPVSGVVTSHLPSQAAPQAGLGRSAVAVQ